MRYRTPAAALVAAVLPALAAAGQQAPALWTALPRPADTGKPIIDDPQFAAKADNGRPPGCSLLLQCRLRLLGVIQNNGAVELRATAFTW